ncbi:MAG: hypothetical protein EGR85_07620 [Subdoligranulum sp.]|nr:hypothetical protein [Subdoligranulum sp.]
MNERERLSSRLGFIMLSAGCAIGCGNVWKFPWMCGQNGGGSFMLLYILCLLVLGLPVMVMEFAVGRAAQASPITMYQRLEKPGHKWGVFGVFSLLGNVALMAFYTVVTGWILYYFVKFLTGQQADFGFAQMIADPGVNVTYLGVTVLLAFLILSFNLQGGLERVTKVMMTALLVLMLVLAGHSLPFSGAAEGLRFYLVPDFSAIDGSVVVAAMNQAFFSLSVGMGGMANVYRGTDTKTGNAIAVKVLKEEFLDNEELVRRFKNESKAISILSHPNIVKVYDVSVTDRLQYIVMEYVDGITLKEYLKQRGGALTWKETVHFATQVLSALQHAHSKGIIHRDVKPQNIMLLADGSIKMMDFGIARFSRAQSQTVSDKAIGSVHYISPEQAKGDKTDARTDIYSVGVMLYEMLSGKLPENAPFYNEDRAFTVLSDTLGGALLDSRQALSAVDDPYYHTDHHWTTMGAQAVYEQWAAATGHAVRHYDLTLASDRFRGTLYSKVLLPDSVYDSVYYAPEIAVDSVVCDGEDGTLYDLSALERKDKYELFLGGNYGKTVITTGVENGKHLLLVKDSFANAFVPFLTGDYETITMIDLRYYRDSMQSLADESTDILVLTEMSNLAASGDYFKLSR